MVVFESIARKGTLAQDVADAILAAVISGKFKPGTKLPGQRNLAEQFGTSIATVREAISVLTATGVIKVIQGYGTVVRDMDETENNSLGWFGLIVSKEDLDDFLEARLLLESFIISKVSENITSEQMGQLEDALEAMKKSLKDPKTYPEKDLYFHRKLAEIAGNKIILRMADAFYSLMREQISKPTIQGLKKDNINISYNKHALLLESIRNKDEDKAISLIMDMLDFARGRWAAAGKQTAPLRPAWREKA